MVRSKDEGKRMIENLVRKLKQMNKFLAGLIEYWDYEAAMNGSEMERSAYEHGQDGKDTEEVSSDSASCALIFLFREMLILLQVASKWMEIQSLLLLIFLLRKKMMTMKFLLN